MAWKFIHCVFSDKAQKVFIVAAVAFRNSLCMVATELYKAASQPLLYFIAHSSPFGFLFWVGLDQLRPPTKICNPRTSIELTILFSWTLCGSCCPWAPVYLYLYRTRIVIQFRLSPFYSRVNFTRTIQREVNNLERQTLYVLNIIQVSCLSNFKSVRVCHELCNKAEHSNDEVCFCQSLFDE